MTTFKIKNIERNITEILRISVVYKITGLNYYSRLESFFIIGKKPSSKNFIEFNLRNAKVTTEKYTSQKIDFYFSKLQKSFKYFD